MMNKKEKSKYLYLNISGEVVNIDDFNNTTNKESLVLSDDNLVNMIFLKNCINFLTVQLASEQLRSEKK